MLSIFDSQQPINRRAMLTVGGLGVAGAVGLDLPQLLAARAEKKSYTTGKSVIFLMQHGGPTQFETFDPKMDVDEAIRTVGGVAQTSIPGVHFGSSMSRLARLADKLAVVRSYVGGSSGHGIRPVVSNETLKANLGSVYARLTGVNHSVTGMPTNVAIDPTALDPSDNGPDVRFGKFTQTGSLGKMYEPFVPGGGSNLQENMKLLMPLSRFDDRKGLLQSLDSLKNEIDTTGVLEGVGRIREQAYEMLIRGVGEAFDISREDPQTIARYDTSQYISETKYANVSNGKSTRHWYQTNARTLGRLLLLARRLCEAGCGFVTVTTQFVWDMHGDKNNVGVARGMDAVGNPFDHAVSAFIEDCEDRGLSDDIMLVSTGEMGRTPKINNRGGRDHWGGLTPLMLYGGGISGGQIVGQSSKDGGQPATSPMGNENLVATILQTLFDIGDLRLQSSLPSELIEYATSGTPIPVLID
ncbi:DUF1501 domain-containing protein [Pirellulaceae bacterium]|jgi:hypothetical protein|nr:DUF1501 domain-containing protein [Pirellulaceae bacterium]